MVQKERLLAGQRDSGTDFVIDVDLIILATGFVHVVHEGLIKDMALTLDDRGNVAVTNYQSSNPRVLPPAIPSAVHRWWSMQ